MMTLGELIEILQKADQSRVVPIGFHRPHSYRGYYSCVAFELKDNITVEEMLESAKSALGATFVGYKGGEYKMDNSTDVYLAEYGRLGEEIGPVLLGYMLGNIGKEGDGAELSVVTDHLERLKAENVRMEAAQYWLELRDELKSAAASYKRRCDL